MLNRIRLASLLLAVPFLSSPPRASKTLDVDPVYQETPVWCWAAVGEMVFRYFGVENINPGDDFQCGIIALINPICNQNCGNCQVPAGSLATMNNMLTQYPTVAGRVTGTVTRISTLTSRNNLSLASVIAEINAGRPVVAGISPSGARRGSGASEHVALIVGYDDDELIVNDPFPFALAFTANPYERAGGNEIDTGQYQIAYDDFVSRLQWRETIYRISCSGADCSRTTRADDSRPAPAPRPEPVTRYGRSCQTRVGRCGPFYNQPALPVGSDCFCGTALGPISGTVVQP